MVLVKSIEGAETQRKTGIANLKNTNVHTEHKAEESQGKAYPGRSRLDEDGGYVPTAGFHQWDALDGLALVREGRGDGRIPELDSRRLLERVDLAAGEWCETCQPASSTAVGAKTRPSGVSWQSSPHLIPDHQV